MAAAPEPIHDIAHLGSVELLTPRPDKSLWYFRDLLGMEPVHEAGPSVYLRGYGDYATSTLKLTAAKDAGVGCVSWRAASEQALERRGHLLHGRIEVEWRGAVRPAAAEHGELTGEGGEALHRLMHLFEAIVHRVVAAAGREELANGGVSDAQLFVDHRGQRIDVRCGRQLGNAHSLPPCVCFVNRQNPLRGG